MKYIKILAMLLLPLSFAACSDDEEFNTGEATVGFANATMEVSEKATTIQVPLSVTGDHNGTIKVNIVVKDSQGTALEIDKNIILTSEILYMPAGIEKVSAEIYSSIETETDDYDRSFTLEITSAEGAAIGTASCKVNISEVVDPYEKLLGKYTMTADDLTSPTGASVSFDVTLTEGIAGKTYKVLGFDGYLADFADEGEFWTLQYNESEETLSVVKGDYYATNVPFTVPGDCCVAPFDFTPDGKDIIPTTSWDATWNESFNTITFEENAIIGIAIYSGGTYWNWAGAYYNITLTKK